MVLSLISTSYGRIFRSDGKVNSHRSRDAFAPVPFSSSGGKGGLTSVASTAFSTNGSFPMLPNIVNTVMAFTVPIGGTINSLSVHITANHGDFGYQGLILQKLNSSGTVAASVILQNAYFYGPYTTITGNPFDQNDQDVTYSTLASIPIGNNYTYQPLRTTTNVVGGVTNVYNFDCRLMGTFLPDGSLSGFTNVDVAGSWLLVSDGTGHGSFGGTITSFSMDLGNVSGSPFLKDQFGNLITVPRYVSETPSFAGKSPRSAGEP